MPVATGFSYLIAAGLVGLFVQAFEYWQGLTVLMGRGVSAWAPVGIAGALLISVLIVHGRPGRWVMPLAGLAVAGAALALCDPAFPAKRIHVAEYALIALVLRVGASRFASGWPLTVTVTCLAGLLGVHDELIQGLHPDRTFGLRDVGVDILGGLAGALLAHRPAARPQDPPGEWLPAILLVLAALALELAALLLTAIREGDPGLATPPPLWAGAPVFAAGIAILLLAPRGPAWAAHLGRMSLALAVPTPIYILLPHATSLAFR
jgi:hypothetical protein